MHLELGHGPDRILLSIEFTLYHSLCYGVYSVHNVYGVNYLLGLWEQDVGGSNPLAPTKPQRSAEL